MAVMPEPTITELSEDILLLNHDRETLYQRIADNSSTVIEKLRKLYDLKWGVKPGDVVESQGEEYRVVDIVVKADHDPNGRPWITANPRRRDNGHFGTTVRNLFSDWEKVNKQP